MWFKERVNAQHFVYAMLEKWKKIVVFGAILTDLVFGIPLGPILGIVLFNVLLSDMPILEGVDVTGYGNNNNQLPSLALVRTFKI